MGRQKKFLLVALITLLVGLLISQEKTGPRISIDEPNFNFGFAPEGSFMVHQYVIRNIGDEPLQIKRVRTTCGCASAPVKKNLLQPNESTVVTLIFNSTRYFHKTSKAAIISTNDPTRPSEKITFIADMDTVKERAIIVEPKKINVGKGTEFKRHNKAEVKNISNAPVSVQVIDYYAEFLDEPKLSAMTIEPGGKIDIEVSINRKIPGDEVIRASFTIAAMDNSGKELTRITVPVFGGGE